MPIRNQTTNISLHEKVDQNEGWYPTREEKDGESDCYCSTAVPHSPDSDCQEHYTDHMSWSSKTQNEVSQESAPSDRIIPIAQHPKEMVEFDKHKKQTVHEHVLI